MVKGINNEVNNHFRLIFMRTDLSLERGRFASVLPNAAQRFSENECSDRQKSFQKVEDERIRASCNFRKVCVGNISLIMIE